VEPVAARPPAAERAIPWRLSGSYFESCNCDAICPCRRIDGVTGGRSTHGLCMGALSWLVERGEADGVELEGLAVALASWYDDDEPGSPWRFVLYLDDRADERQHEALEAIFLGRLGGDALRHFPWAWKPSVPLAVRTAAIEADHTSRRQWLRVADRVEVRIALAASEGHDVTCVIPGHHQRGEELRAGVLRVDELEPLRFEYRGVCGYAAPFAYSGP
jgi:hypothetical protein